MALYQCKCGFGSRKGARMEYLVRHLRGIHSVDLSWGFGSGLSCENCAGLSLDVDTTFISHLKDWHSMHVSRKIRYLPFASSSSQSRTAHPTTSMRSLYQCHCGSGSGHGRDTEDMIDHVRATHRVKVRNGCSHYAHCNDCPRKRTWSAPRNGAFRRQPLGSSWTLYSWISLLGVGTRLVSK